MVRVKICGVTRVEDALAALDCGADLIGLNFYPPSPRYLEVERAREIARAVAGRAKLVGVFVNAGREQVDSIRRAVGLEMLQFHGDEDEAALAGWPVEVIRALRLGPESPQDPAERSAADFVLIDSYDPKLYGGTGKRVALEALAGLKLERVFISGGLTPDNVGEAARLAPFGVDVASGVELAPGIKDHSKLRRFIENAKSSR